MFEINHLNSLTFASVVVFYYNKTPAKASWILATGTDICCTKWWCGFWIKHLATLECCRNGYVLHWCVTCGSINYTGLYGNTYVDPCKIIYSLTYTHTHKMQWVPSCLISLHCPTWWGLLIRTTKHSIILRCFGLVWSYSKNCTVMFLKINVFEECLIRSFSWRGMIPVYTEYTCKRREMQSSVKHLPLIPLCESKKCDCVWL